MALPSLNFKSDTSGDITAPARSGVSGIGTIYNISKGIKTPYIIGGLVLILIFLKVRK